MVDKEQKREGAHNLNRDSYAPLSDVFSGCRFLSLIALSGISLLLVVIFAVVNSGDNLLNEWVTHQYFFSYQEFGFIKRGLVPSLLNLFPNLLLTRTGLISVSLLIVACAILMFWGFMFWCTVNISRVGRLTITLALLCSPALFMHMGADLGRYDWLGLVISFLSIAFIVRRTMIPVAFLVCLGILVHEAFSVIFVPLLCLITLISYKAELFKIGTLPVKPLLWILAPSVLTLLCTMLWGRAELFNSGAEIRAHMGGNAAFSDIALTPPIDEPFDILTRSLGDNVDLLMSYLGPEGWMPRSYILSAYAWGVFHLSVFIALLIKLGLRLRVEYLAVLSPLLLNLIAVDYARFHALTAINTWVVFLFLLRLNPNIRFLPTQYFILLACSGVLGPLGDIWAFPQTITPRL